MPLCFRQLAPVCAMRIGLDRLKMRRSTRTHCLVALVFSDRSTRLFKREQLPSEALENDECRARVIARCLFLRERQSREAVKVNSTDPTEPIVNRTFNWLPAAGLLVSVSVEARMIASVLLEFRCL